MKLSESEENIRQQAIQRLISGESATSICTSLNRSKPWLYKWLKRYHQGITDWYREQPRTPHCQRKRTPESLENLVVRIRKDLSSHRYAQTGATSIQWEMQKLGVEPLPTWTINRILKRFDLIKKRQPYIPSGKNYPSFAMDRPGSLHIMDSVGPRYLRNDGRFYSHHVIDAYSHQVSILPHRSKSDKASLECLVKAWKSMNLPDYLQLDNALSYRGSNRWPRAFGLVIRFCLHHQVQPVFIPSGEPWRQGIIEHFNHVYGSQFLSRQLFSSFEELQKESLVFERFHNKNHRYSTIGGKTPDEVVGNKPDPGYPLRLPQDYEIPEERLPLEDGYIHLIRFIRSNRQLQIFGESFQLKKTPSYEYVAATIFTKANVIKIHLDNECVEEIEYSIPLDWYGVNDLML